MKKAAPCNEIMVFWYNTFQKTHYNIFIDAYILSFCIVPFLFHVHIYANEEVVENSSF